MMVKPIYAFLTNVAMPASGSPYYFAFWAQAIRFKKFEQSHEFKIGLIFPQVTRVQLPCQSAKHSSHEETNYDSEFETEVVKLGKNSACYHEERHHHKH